VGTIEDPGDIGTFNPRGETIEDAVKRLRPALESRLRAALAGIVHQDRVAFDGVAPVSSRTPTAFEWLVRYQVLGESKAAIARDVDRDRPHVTREVNRLARLIDLTLRAERGGRPRKRAAHTIRVTGREARTRRA
jgi:hypothetical protein